MADIMVGHDVINDEADAMRELADVNLTRKEIFMVSVLVITVAAIGIVADLPISFFHNQLLSVAYAVAIFATFALGMSLLFLSVVLPQMPVSVVAAKKLATVAVGLVHLAFGLRMAIHAIY